MNCSLAPVDTLGRMLHTFSVTAIEIDNYDEEIWDGDLRCTDMYYYSKDLKKK